MIRTLYVEKRQGFDIEAKALLEDFKTNLGIDTIKDVRLINKYSFSEVESEVYEKAKAIIFSEPMVDKVYEDQFPILEGEAVFSVEYLPGQYDQRADSAEQCFQILTAGDKLEIKSSKVVCLSGNISKDELINIKQYYINPVDSREVDPLSKELFSSYEIPSEVKNIHGFINMNEDQLSFLHKELGLAMTIEDLILIKEYFSEENRNPSITEIKVIDTYWSDHCRHTTFLTAIESVEIEESVYTSPIIKSFNRYKEARKLLYKDKHKDMTLMDIAVIAMKELKAKGMLEDLDISDEINACSIKVKVETEAGTEDYLVMFKNETHNHPTEIEPFGGAATCLGGAIRDPLSGRTYVYQAMRVTGSGDPTVAIESTLKGKLPQRKITLGAAHGYSSYGNQIGLATGQVNEIYDAGYVAKRMEIGAVIAAAPLKNVRREEPVKGDIIILLGGRTGRDGCGGATGSSKEHTVESIEQCGAEVQKGNAPTERKLQRLFRNPKVSNMIKRCNDFGAGGVSVAIGELCRGLDINLDLVPKKYEGLDGTELAISESQERMAVVVSKEDGQKFVELALEENLEATIVAEVTDLERMRMFWNGKKIVDLSRAFLDTNGAKQTAAAILKAPRSEENVFNEENSETLRKQWIETLKSLNVASQKGLVERFDSTIGAGTVLMPFGGKYQLTPAEGMAAKIPVVNGEAEEATLMAFGFNPKIAKWSPYHSAYNAVVESVAKIVACGGKSKKVWLTFQEYFEKLGKNPERWGKPLAALLGAYQAQIDLGIAAIGGKDSMSGSFGEMDVPPTLVSFAVAVEKAKNIISPEFKKVNSQVIYVSVNRDESELINIEEFKKNLEVIERLIEEKKIISAYSLKNGGICEGISKMCFGNKIGVRLSALSKEELFNINYGTFILEVPCGVDIDSEFKGASYKIIGETIEEAAIKVLDESFDIDELILQWERKLNKVFKIKTEEENEKVTSILYKNSYKKSPAIKTAKPRVLIPVFPGTNCEYDCARAFEKEGAEVKQLVLKNLTKESLLDSLVQMEKEIKNSQIIMLPGGFSAGDEPDGSAKFIATVFRNERISNAVMELLKNRDGLMLGICNGFQALVKLGLLPYGEIVDMEEEMATLTFNTMGRHMSSIVNTKVVSKLSPWFNEVNLGDINAVPISHGEGRFVAPQELLTVLQAKGQIATQYVDMNGEATLNMPYNPNGSMLAIEGITSPDGRILGKMGHSERIGANLYKNIVGEFDQKLFKSGVNYFK
ncbi:phosphoribosylformylglycinamidine synthase [Clostridium folliculivorans]|uniref:Phosphoribosylformylglycinamidine synthase n=1 Tax=Clostridium folliculivorans TaxID=2886038 RepID=A0A9W5Y261_9CLOT|nr:phosphoribosylformylglycinamidine synthase [Clostridium folliculivorans]GKU25356.1 phosphoribosylformylglycinamidine synthase [Clostridium folliculivorans]GKU28377.1 phosphoribosylformylglycinamidine synthase [Clostridium folliculivorans]